MPSRTATPLAAPTDLTDLMLGKAPTGIVGFDELTDGGLPRGRATLVTGAAGAGKTLFGVEFLVRGALEYGEPGVLLTLEESAADLVANSASVGFDLPALERAGLLAIDAFRVDPAEFVQTGAFDLEALFVRVATAAANVDARRVLIDTVEVLFPTLGDERVVRAELGRLFRWLKDAGLTTVVTGERGHAGSLTRHGIEEYISDCVVTLDHRVTEEMSTRRLRVVKYKGSAHGTNEYPFVMTHRGIRVLGPAQALAHAASEERISSGVPELDEMLCGGVYRGSSLLISGPAGTGKSSLALQAAEAACTRGERVLVISFAELPAQIVRNMASVGIDLAPHCETGLLQMWAEQLTASGLEANLGRLNLLLDEIEPSLVVLSSVGSLAGDGVRYGVLSGITRHIDMLQSRGITVIVTSLTRADDQEGSNIGVSSQMDTWLMVRNLEFDGERTRHLSVIKSRGTANSNQVREFLLTSTGPKLLEVVVGSDGVVTGSAREAGLARASAVLSQRRREAADRRGEFDQRTAVVEAEIAVMRARLEAEGLALEDSLRQTSTRASEDDEALRQEGRLRRGSLSGPATP